MNKHIKIDKKNKLEDTSRWCLNEQDNNNIDIGEKEMLNKINYHNLINNFASKKFEK